jgi:hypothetical protein
MRYQSLYGIQTEFRSSERAKISPMTAAPDHHIGLPSEVEGGLAEVCRDNRKTVRRLSGWGLQAPWWIWIAPAGDKLTTRNTTTLNPKLRL